jgi:predicted nucleic acid-binding protein
LFKQYAHQGPTARDVIHVAVMRNNGLSRIVTTDEHFERFEGIKRLDPLLLFSQAN